MIKKSKLFKFSCICALAFSFLGTSANAYNVFGYSWPSKYVNYAVDSNVPTSYVQPIVDAATMWYDNTDVCLERNNSSDINVYTDYYGNCGWDGVSYMNGVKVDTCEQPYSYGAVYLNQSLIDNYSNLREKLVVAHELGHELGLAHTDDNTVLMYGGDVWNAYKNNPNLADAPASDDINGIDCIY